MFDDCFDIFFPFAGNIGKCFGLPKKMCAAGVPKSETLGDMDEEEQLECANLFCHPMCTENTITCEFEFKGPFAESSDSKFATALCRQIIAYACAKNECCVEPTDLKKETGKQRVFSPLIDWVEEGMYGQDDDMRPLVPLPYCRDINSLNKEAADIRCATCKKFLSVRVVQLSPLDGCERLYGQIPVGEDAEMYTDELPPVDGSGSSGPQSLLKRCTELRTKMLEKIGELKANSKICECAGCCKPSSDSDDACIIPDHHFMDFGMVDFQ